MSNGEKRLCCKLSSNRVLNQGISLDVDTGSGFIEEDNLAIFNQSSSKRYQRTLAQ